MLPRQDLAEGAPYDHDQYGRVRVALVGEERVSFEQTERTLPNSQFHPMHSEPLDEFRAAVEPLPITVAVPSQTGSVSGGLQ